MHEGPRALNTAPWREGCLRRRIPSVARIESVGDDADVEDVYDTEPLLLYIACTRARDHLLVTGVAGSTAAGEAAPKQHEVEPYWLERRDQLAYLHAYSYRAEAELTFRLDRVVNVALTQSLPAPTAAPDLYPIL